MSTRCILIDGYNVIRNTPGLLAAERQSLAAGRERLLAQVTARYQGSPHRILVVFDGNGTGETACPLRCGVRSQVVFTRAGESADAFIVRYTRHARAEGMEVTVVSDDWEIRLGGSVLGAESATSSEMAGRLNAPPRHVARQARHRAAVRSLIQHESDDDDGALRGHARKGNPRRPPRRRRGPQPGPAL
jgi:uncharacterized protein